MQKSEWMAWLGGWESFITNYPGLTDDSVPEMASKPWLFLCRCLEKKKVWVSILNATRWVCFQRTYMWMFRCSACSDVIEALILGNDSFHLKRRFMNKAVMITICMCGWGMLGQTGKQGDVFDPWMGSVRSHWFSYLACCDLVPTSVCCGTLSLQFHSISHKMCC